MHKSIIRAGLAATAALVLVAAGCGDDDGDDTAAEAEGASADTGSEVGPYCDAALAIESAAPDIDFQSASPEEMAEGFQVFASETLQPLVADAVAAAPEEVAEEVEVMSAAVDEIAESGDPSVFERPEADAANDALHAYELENCGWHRHDVSATEYAYDGIPETLEAGPTSFELTNDGAEVHELLLVRKNDGVTQTAEELLALPEEEALMMVTEVGSGAFASPGDTEYSVVDLEAGDYVAVCFIPTGMTSEEQTAAEDAPPHFVHGMVHEFTVS
jgi:hypothetical protein